jgi:hypothetical protein
MKKIIFASLLGIMACREVGTSPVHPVHTVAVPITDTAAMLLHNIFEAAAAEDSSKL